MKAMKRLFVMMILLLLGYVVFMLSPFLELLDKEEEINDNSK